MIRKFSWIEIALMVLAVGLAFPLWIFDRLIGPSIGNASARLVRGARLALMLTGGYALLVSAGLARSPF